MRFVLTPTHWILAELDPIEWDFLDRLPLIASGDEFSEDCRRRLLPDPISGPSGTGGGHGGLRQDWNEFVKPDLESSFAADRDQVDRDLALALATQDGDVEETGNGENLTDAGDNQADRAATPGIPVRVVIARESAEAWYGALNQARLLMNEAHQLAEAMERFRWPEPGSGEEVRFDPARLLLLAQYEFYTALQSILIETLMKDPGESATEEE